MRVKRLALIALIPLLLSAQTRTAFELASIRPSSADDTRRPQIQFLPGNRLIAVNYPLLMLIGAAWQVPFNQSPRMTGVPDWAGSTRYNISAQAGKGSIKPGLPPRERNDAMRRMLQNLLIERFKLDLRHETKELPVFGVVVGKGGLKLPKADIDEKDCTDTCHQILGGQGRGLHADAATIADLGRYVENWAERPVLDQTGVSGLFKIQTRGWISLRPVPAAMAGAKAEDGTYVADLPTLFEVFETMGLKLEPQKATVDVYHVEHIEHPSEN